MIGRNRDALHGNKRFDPFAGPGAVSIGCKFTKRTEGESGLLLSGFFLPCPDLVVVTACSQCQRIE